VGYGAKLQQKKRFGAYWESKSAALVAAVFDGFLRKSVQHSPAGFKGPTSKRKEGRTG